MLVRSAYCILKENPRMSMYIKHWMPTFATCYSICHSPIVWSMASTYCHYWLTSRRREQCSDAIVWKNLLPNIRISRVYEHAIMTHVRCIAGYYFLLACTDYSSRLHTVTTVLVYAVVSPGYYAGHMSFSFLSLWRLGSLLRPWILLLPFLSFITLYATCHYGVVFKILSNFYINSIKQYN